MENSIDVCVLAAGKGARMKSSKPKILHELAGKPLVAHVLEAVVPLNAAAIHVVVGSGSEMVRATFADQDLNFVEQAEQLGTGHAVMQAAAHLTAERTLILVGDAPLITSDSLKDLISQDRTN